MGVVKNGNWRHLFTAAHLSFSSCHSKIAWHFFWGNSPPRNSPSRNLTQTAIPSQIRGLALKLLTFGALYYVWGRGGGSVLYIVEYIAASLNSTH